MKSFFRIVLLFFMVALVGCQKAPRPGYTELPNVVTKRKALEKQILELLPEKNRQAAANEAIWLADTAFKASAAIARYNAPKYVNWLNNRAVNSKNYTRHRGLCWHYQHDLYRELRRRPLKFYKLGCFSCTDNHNSSSEWIECACMSHFQLLYTYAAAKMISDFID